MSAGDAQIRGATWGERLRGWRRPQHVLLLVLGLIVAEWALTGVRVIREDQQGVVLQFGAVRRVAPPGLLFTLPWPFERAIAVKTTEVRTMPVGYRLVDAVRGVPPAPKEVEWVSADTNILNVSLTVKYAVTDPVKYLFRVGPGDADFLVRRCAESRLTELVATMSIDEILTHGKTRIQEETRLRTQEELDLLEAGIRIVAVNLGDVVPPENVIEAFNDVSTAKSEMSRMVNDADGYAKDLLPRARALADRMVQEAEAYRATAVARAQGETSRFRDLLAEARRARRITETRLYLEAMSRILTQPRLIVLDGQDDSNKLRLLE